ncbi:MAG: hypothetical protein WBQ14_00430 [Gaiellaceae bacterium]
MRTSSSSTRLLGLVAGLVAAWGGIVAFAGPSFSFRIVGTTSSWVWNQNHATVWFVGGVAGIVGGLLMLVGLTRGQQILGALVTGASGIWFLIGPSLLPLWSSGAPSGVNGTSSGAGMRALEAIGYSYGTGALVVLIAALSFGILVASPSPTPAMAPAAAEAESRHRKISFHHHHPSHA